MRALICGLVAVSLVACGPEPEPEPELPVALCGMEPYELLDSSEVGGLVDWQEVGGLDLDATALDSLIAPANIDSLLPSPYGARVFLYRYVTQERGRTVEATSIAAVPANADVPAEAPILLVTHGTTGFHDPCAPGRDFAAQLLMAAFAGQGYVVVAPDFIGMTSFGAPATVHHPYMVGEPTAIASWDAARAVVPLLEAAGTESRPTNRVAIFGASQGGHAAFFTERVGPYYAPELDVFAVVPAVPPIDATEMMAYAVDGTSGIEVLFAAALNAQRHWYGAPEDMSGALVNEAPGFLSDNIDTMMYEGADCDPGGAADGVIGDGEIYLADFAAAARAGTPPAPWDCYAQEGSMNTSSIPRLRSPPYLVVAGENDTLIPPDTVRAGVEALCAQGDRIQHLECMNAGHGSAVLWSLGDFLGWIAAREADEPLDESAVCQLAAPRCCMDSPAAECTP